MTANPVRKAYKKVAPAIWQTIRRQYEAGQSPTLLCQQYGISPSTFFTRRKHEGWEQVATDLPKADILATGGAEAQLSDLDGTPDFCDQIDCSDAQEPVYADMGGDLSTNSELPLQMPSTEVISARHVEIASVLQYKLDQLLADEYIGAGPQGRKSRSLLDLATTLEKLQRIERKALAMDEPGAQSTQRVVILVPQKLDEDEWVQQAHKLMSLPEPE